MNKSADPKSDKLKAVYAERSVDDQRAIYRDWAQTYDKQTQEEFGWMGFQSAAREFARRVTDRNAAILDAGCGTGLSGKALAQHGFGNLHGRDLSPEMLAKAEELNVYQTLQVCDLTSPLEETGLFDHVISVGVFGFGPPDPEHIPHLVSVIRPGGLAAITVNGKGWADRNWEQVLPEVINKSGLNLEEQTDIEYLANEDISGKLLFFRA